MARTVTKDQFGIIESTRTVTLTEDQFGIIESALYFYGEETETNIGEWEARFEDEPGLSEDLDEETGLLERIQETMRAIHSDPND